MSLQQLKKSQLLLVSYGNGSEQMSNDYQVTKYFFWKVHIKVKSNFKYRLVTCVRFYIEKKLIIFLTLF
jgi:hypothetical protein